MQQDTSKKDDDSKSNNSGSPITKKKPEPWSKKEMDEAQPLPLPNVPDE